MKKIFALILSAVMLVGCADRGAVTLYEDDFISVSQQGRDTHIVEAATGKNTPAH